MRRLVFMSLGMMVGVLGQFEAPWPALLVSLLALGGLWAVATRLVAALWFWAGVLAAFLCLAGARPGPEPESRERGWGGILQVTGTSVSGGADTVWQARLAGLVGRSQCALSRSGGSLLRAGDLWLGRATVSPPAGADNPHSFDYRSHLRRRGVVWQARFDRVILLQSGRGPAGGLLSWPIGIVESPDCLMAVVCGIHTGAS